MHPVFLSTERMAVIMEITRDTLIGEIVENCPEAMPLFQEIGMHCMGCALASGENVEEACNAHGVEVEPFLERLNTFIAQQH